MLKLKPHCERCNAALPPHSAHARICFFECTFCAGCAELGLGGRCPNCGGELVTRPRRPDADYPGAPAARSPSDPKSPRRGCVPA